MRTYGTPEVPGRQHVPLHVRPGIPSPPGHLHAISMAAPRRLHPTTLAPNRIPTASSRIRSTFRLQLSRRLKATGKLQVIQELADEAFFNDNGASEEPDEDTDDEDGWGEDEDDEDE